MCYHTVLSGDTHLNKIYFYNVSYLLKKLFNVLFVCYFSYLMVYELEFVEYLISQDMRNNSAWNQRYFVINNSDPNADMIDKELQYTFDKIKILSKNESAWNYIRG